MGNHQKPTWHERKIQLLLLLVFVYFVWVKLTSQWLLAALVHGPAKITFSATTFRLAMFLCDPSVRSVCIHIYFLLIFVFFLGVLCIIIFLSGFYGECAQEMGNEEALRLHRLSHAVRSKLLTNRRRGQRNQGESGCMGNECRWRMIHFSLCSLFRILYFVFTSCIPFMIHRWKKSAKHSNKKYKQK